MDFVKHLLINKGDTAPILLPSLWHGGFFRCASPASTSPKVIHITPIGVTLSVGDRLIYGNGCNFLEVAATYLPKDEMISVLSIPVPLLVNVGFRAKPINVTGWSGFSSIRPTFDSVVRWDFGVSIHGDPADGTFKLDPTPFASTIVANCSWKNTIGMNGFDLDDIDTWGKLTKTHYYWDLELVDSGGIRKRRMQGGCLVSSEVTP